MLATKKTKMNAKPYFQGKDLQVKNTLQRRNLSTVVPDSIKKTR